MMIHAFSTWRLSGLVACGLCAGLCLLANSTLAVAQAPTSTPSAPASTSAGLEIVVRNGWTASGHNEARCDMGVIDPLLQSKTARDFTLKNAGSALITITSLQPTCGCTAVFGDSPGSDATSTAFTLPPGSETTVHSVLDATTILRPGPFDKTILVLTREQIGAAFTLHLTGSVKAPIAFSLPLVDFGRASAGQSKSVKLTATLAPEILHWIRRPRLVSTVADIQITQLNHSDAISTTDPITYTCMLTLSAAACIGPLTGRVRFVDGSTDQTPTAVALHSGQTPEANYLAGLYVPIVGEVAGHIAAFPMSVVFGSVPSGQSATRQVTVIGRSPGILDGLTLASSSPYLSARLVLPRSAAGESHPNRLLAGTAPALDPSITLEATLSPKAPVGGLKAEITVTTRNHERLVLPVLLDVAAK